MKKVYVLVIFALVVLNVFLWGVLVINNLNEKTTGLMKLQLIKNNQKLKTMISKNRFKNIETKSSNYF